MTPDWQAFCGGSPEALERGGLTPTQVGKQTTDLDYSALTPKDLASELSKLPDFLFLRKALAGEMETIDKRYFRIPIEFKEDREI